MNKIWFVALAPMLLASCIDEDLSGCGYDYAINYNVKLQTNLTAELSTELQLVEEQGLADILRRELAGIFTDKAQDVDLLFYTDHKLKQHEQHQINANASSFTIYLPIDDYKHLALANMQACPGVAATGQQVDTDHCLSNMASDTVESHAIGLFSARLPMQVQDKDQEFNVQLNMLNSVPVLIIDTQGYSPTSIEGYTGGFATHFMVNDSTYTRDGEQTVRAKLLTDEGDFRALYSVNFPSPDAADTRADTPQWHYHVYVTINGNCTQNVVTVNTPLTAGALKILKFKMQGDGSLVGDLPDVGVSVTLDWNKGTEFDVPI